MLIGAFFIKKSSLVNEKENRLKIKRNLELYSGGCVQQVSLGAQPERGRRGGV